MVAQGLFWCINYISGELHLNPLNNFYMKDANIHAYFLSNFRIYNIGLAGFQSKIKHYTIIVLLMCSLMYLFQFCFLFLTDLKKEEFTNSTTLFF